MYAHLCEHGLRYSQLLYVFYVLLKDYYCV